jgi:hypothetical protein
VLLIPVVFAVKAAAPTAVTLPVVFAKARSTNCGVIVRHVVFAYKALKPTSNMLFEPVV